MEFVNSLYQEAQLDQNTLLILLKLIAPFSPHLAQQLWHDLKQPGFIAQASWPEYQEEFLQEDIKIIALQINGKLRDTLQVSVDISREDLLAKAKENPKISKQLIGRTIIKEIVVPQKIVNFVIKVI